MDTITHAPTTEDAQRATDRVMHFELPWTTHLAINLRRPQRLLVFEVAWLVVLVGAIAGFGAAARTTDVLASVADIPTPIKLVFVALMLIGSVRRIWSGLVTVWHGQGGLDRIAIVRGSRLTVGAGSATTHYDLTRARTHRIGRFVRVTSSMRRWAPDYVPVELLDGLEFGPPVPAPIATASDVVIGTTWRDARADALELVEPRASMASIAPLLILMTVAISGPIPGSLIVAMLAAFTLFSSIVWGVVWLGALTDSYRGVIVRLSEEGLVLEDVDHSGLYEWDALQLAAIGHDRIVIPGVGLMRARPLNQDTFDEIEAQLRERRKKPLARRDPVRPTPAWRLVAWPIRLTAGLVGFAALALTIDDSNSLIAFSVPMFAAIAVTYVAVSIPPITRSLLHHALVRPPRLDPLHHQPRNEPPEDEVWTIRDLRFGSLVLLAAPLLVAGVVLMVVGELEPGTYALGGGLLVALAAQYLLPDLQQETSLAVGSAVAAGVAGCFLLLSASGHPGMTIIVAGVVCATLAGLLATAQALDGHYLPVAQLSRSFVVATYVAAVVGGTGALFIAGQSRITDISSDEAIVTHPVIGDTSLRGVRLEDAYADAERITVYWNGNSPRVASTSGMFDKPGGAVARQRIIAVLREAAEEPGPRPAVREIVLTSSWYGVAANHAVNEISHSNARWPGAAREWIREETRQNDWISRYYPVTDRIVISRRESKHLLHDLHEPLGTVLDRKQSFSFHVLRHEIEHGMSSSGGEPQWIVEATAELLTQWAGREQDVLRAAAFGSVNRERMYGGDYERWGRLLHTLLDECDLSTEDPQRFEEAARLLRDPDRLAQYQLADCLAEEVGVERDGLEDLVADAGTSDQAYDELLDRIGVRH